MQLNHPFQLSNVDSAEGEAWEAYGIQWSEVISLQESLGCNGKSAMDVKRYGKLVAASCPESPTRAGQEHLLGFSGGGPEPRSSLNREFARFLF